MICGRIKCIFQSRGYGFIEDHTGREVYFNISSIEDVRPENIERGSMVYFDLINTSIGLEAMRVRSA